jgi:hypothetical protein
MMDKIRLVLSAVKSFCDRRFHVSANNWIGVRIVASWRDGTSDQQIDPPLEASSPLQPLTQTTEHFTLLSTAPTNQRGALAANLRSARKVVIKDTQKIQTPERRMVIPSRRFELALLV